MRIPGILRSTCFSSSLLVAFLAQLSRTTIVWNESVNGTLSANQARRRRLLCPPASIR